MKYYPIERLYIMELKICWNIKNWNSSILFKRS
jgi:hypothetical protein